MSTVETCYEQVWCKRFLHVVYGVHPCASYDIYSKRGLLFYTTLIHCSL